MIGSSQPVADEAPQQAHQIVLASATLAEILGAPASEHDRLVEDMHNHEAKSAELHFAIALLAPVTGQR